MLLYIFESVCEEIMLCGIKERLKERQVRAVVQKNQDFREVRMIKWPLPQTSTKEYHAKHIHHGKKALVGTELVKRNSHHILSHVWIV